MLCPWAVRSGAVPRQRNAMSRVAKTMRPVGRARGDLTWAVATEYDALYRRPGIGGWREGIGCKGAGARILGGVRGRRSRACGGRCPDPDSPPRGGLLGLLFGAVGSRPVGRERRAGSLGSASARERRWTEGV